MMDLSIYKKGFRSSILCNISFSTFPGKQHDSSLFEISWIDVRKLRMWVWFLWSTDSRLSLLYKKFLSIFHRNHFPPNYLYEWIDVKNFLTEDLKSWKKPSRTLLLCDTSLLTLLCKILNKKKLWKCISNRCNQITDLGFRHLKDFFCTSQATSLQEIWLDFRL